MLPEPILVLVKIASVLQRLGVPYFVGGAMASAVHGVARATRDVDVIADLRTEHAEPLAAALQSEFHFDDRALAAAIRRRGRFSAVHLSSMFVVDLFVAGDEPYARAQMERRREEQVCPLPECSAYFATAEDVVLAMLSWYRDAADRPARHWADLMGVVRTQGEALDRHYLGRWAEALGLTTLLRRALYQGGLQPVHE